MKLADIKEKQMMEDYYKYRNEVIKRDSRLKPGNQVRKDWEKKFVNSKKIPPEEDDKKRNLWLKYVGWKQKLVQKELRK
jgi:hypothetical protein